MKSRGGEAGGGSNRNHLEDPMPERGGGVTESMRRPKDATGEQCDYKKKPKENANLSILQVYKKAALSEGKEMQREIHSGGDHENRSNGSN